MTLGGIANARATTGARIVTLRAQIQELEKLARKTPPKTLAAEVAKVQASRAVLPKLVQELAKLMVRYAALKELEETMK